MKVSIFENINAVKSPYYIDIEVAYERIKTGKSQILVDKIRSEIDKKRRNELKLSLPCICFSGTFRTRKKADIIQHSGYVVLDFDDVENISSLKEKLINDDYINAVWLSPSGTGLKAIVKIPSEISKHEVIFDNLKNYYPDIDSSGRDVSRICFESYDPEIYVKKNSLIFDKIVDVETFMYKEKEPEILLTDEKIIIEKIDKWLQKSESFLNGNRNKYMCRLASALNRYGVSEQTALQHCLCFEQSDFQEKEITSIIKSAYKNQKSLFNTQYFENSHEKKQIRKNIISGRPTEKIIKQVCERNSLNENFASKLVEKEKNKLENNFSLFWEVKVSKSGYVEKITFVRYKFLKWLQKNGFYRFKVSLDYIMLIRINENIVSQISISDIRNFVFNFIENLTDEPFDNIDKYILFEFLSKGITNYFSKDMFDLLPFIDLNLNKDTKDIAYFYYQNNVVKVTSKEIITMNYSDLDGLVWENKIINRHINLTYDDFTNDYQDFLIKITSDSNRRVMTSAIGYLLHRYKDRSMSKAIIFNDKEISDNPEGGTGKGLIMEGIKKIRKVETMNGKNFTFDKTFAFQRIDIDSEIIFFDDVKKYFDFERLFSIITEGIDVEKKNKGEFFIPFENSPKIAIATNYFIKGEGSSNERRKIDIELTNHFNSKHTPLDEYGKLLFDDWTPGEWNDFDNSMLFCCQYYLKNGLKQFISDSIIEKKMIANTSSEFLEFIENVQIATELNRKEIFTNFVQSYPANHKISLKRFVNWIKIWCDYKNYEFVPNKRRSGNEFFIQINPK